MFNPKTARDVHFRLPVQCIWLRLNGSWPLKATPVHQQSGSESYSYFPKSLFNYLYTTWSWYVIISVGITITYQTAFLIYTFGDIMMTTENCCTTLMGVLNFVRLLHLRLHQHQLRNILETFVDEIWIVKNTHARIERACEKNMKTFSVISTLMTCLILMYCCMPLVELYLMGLDAPEKPFPYKMLFPYDAHHGWPYIFTYIFTAYAGICVVTTLFSEDSLFGFLITYTCGQFHILHESIDNLVPQAHAAVAKRISGANEASFMDFQREYTRHLNKIANMHSKLIEFSALLENFFSSILLANFVISSILICMVGFQLVTGKDMFIGDYAKFIVYISSSLSQLYVLCHNGDMLIQNSTETAKHLYACNWEGSSADGNTGDVKLLDKRRPDNTQIYPANKDFRLNLQIMILCSQRPVKITALKFSTLSLQSFTRILSTSMSYFTLLQTVYQESQ